MNFNTTTKTLHNICYRQIVLLIIFAFISGKESYSVMYPSYDINLINKIEVDNFHNLIESSVLNRCNECVLEYNTDKIILNNYDEAFSYGSKLNNNKVIFFEINRFNKKIKLIYYILNIDNGEKNEKIISYENIADLKSSVQIVVNDFLIDNVNSSLDKDSLNLNEMPRFGLFWGKYYNYRNSYNSDQWNLTPNEFTSIGVTRIFSRKENQFKQLDLNINSSKQNVSDIGINILFNEKLSKYKNHYLFHGAGIGFHIATWEQYDENIYFSKNNFSFNYQSGIVLFDKNKYSLMLRFSYQCLINDDFNDLIGLNLIFLSTNTETYEKAIFNEIEFEFFDVLLKLFFETLFNSRENN